MSKGGKREGAGRPPGVLNKDKEGLQALLAAKYPEWDPVMAMADVANDMEMDPIMRFTAAKEVAQYVHPKRKAMDVTTNGKDVVIPIVGLQVVEKKGDE